MQKKSLRNAFIVAVPFMIMLAGYADEVARNAKMYGVRQIEQMCDDRPDMLEVFPPDHPIRRWCISQFETGENGKRMLVIDELSNKHPNHQSAELASVWPRVIRVCVPAMSRSRESSVIDSTLA